IYRELTKSRDRVDALLEGETDIIFGLSPSEVQRLKDREDIAVSAAPGNSHVAVQMDARYAPFDNPNLRKALAWAVPYQEILDEVFPGGTARPWRGVIPEAHNGYMDCLTVTTDLERSKSYLRDAGHANGFAATLYVDSGVHTLVEVANRVSRSAARAG